jgi:DNA-binding response OmpR family regulator
MTNLYPPQQRRILLLDDDVRLRTLFGTMLSSEGFDISHANSGSEALQLHNKTPFDLVVIELNLQECDSFQTLVELRRHPCKAKFIATARSNRMNAEINLRMAEHLGALRVLHKPFSTEVLLSAVRETLAG